MKNSKKSLLAEEQQPRWHWDKEEQGERKTEAPGGRGDMTCDTAVQSHRLRLDFRALFCDYSGPGIYTKCLDAVTFQITRCRSWWGWDPWQWERVESTCNALYTRETGNEFDERWNR